MVWGLKSWGNEIQNRYAMYRMDFVHILDCSICREKCRVLGRVNRYTAGLAGVREIGQFLVFGCKELGGRYFGRGQCRCNKAVKHVF